MTVLVAIPYYHDGEWIKDAVDSVARQSYGDVVILVAGDGEEPPPRSWPYLPENLRTVTFPTNEGVGLTLQAMLLGSRHEWFAPMGADDWIDPEYLERLLSLGGPANASGEIWHNDFEQSLVHDRAHTEFGVFNADLLRSVGGYGVKRCGQDTLLYEDILPHFTSVRYLDEPHYHKRLHAGSLTSSPETGYGSEYRTNVVWHNKDVTLRCAQMGWDPVMTRTFRDSLVPENLRPVLAERVELVKAALA